jgi:hypothetical protein
LSPVPRCSPTRTTPTWDWTPDYAVKQVNHSKGEYVSGIVHTNGIENFWSGVKRGIKGTQIHVSPEHLQR